MQIKCKYLRRTSAISLITKNRSSKKKWRSGWNLDELNECSLAGGERKQEN